MKPKLHKGNAQATRRGKTMARSQLGSAKMRFSPLPHGINEANASQRECPGQHGGAEPWHDPSLGRPNPEVYALTSRHSSTSGPVLRFRDISQLQSTPKLRLHLLILLAWNFAINVLMCGLEAQDLLSHCRLSFPLATLLRGRGLGFHRCAPSRAFPSTSC